MACRILREDFIRWLNMTNVKSRIDIEKEIGERLAIIRKSRGVFQKELADRLGLSQPNISDIERGRLRLSAWQIVEIAKALNVSADKILGLEETKETPAIKRKFLRKLREIDQLSVRDQQAIIRLLDAFLIKR